MQLIKAYGLVGLALVGMTATADAAEITIGSKKFTESVILGEMLHATVEQSGQRARHRSELGGTRVLFDALQHGDIDLYVEYTGTLERELLRDSDTRTLEKMRDALAGLGIGMGRPLGFNNTYAVGMLDSRAGALGIIRTSDLKEYAELVFGFGNEFMNREDGWPALQAAYDLPQRNVTGLDHDLAYRGLGTGSIDAMDVYTTDAKIVRYGIRVLEDDLQLFPRYEAVVLYRLDLDTSVIAALASLEGRINEATMMALNARVTLTGESEKQVARQFLGLNKADNSLPDDDLWTRLARTTSDHLVLVGISLGSAIILAIPLGIVAFRRPRFGQAILGIAGIVQTIPTLALFVFMIPLLGIGAPPAIMALFLYSLLPIIRNTHAGLSDIPVPLRESAIALGLTNRTILWRIEMPLAARSILSGIKTSAVINVGTASLGALIGAGGYGQPILTGIRLADTELILEGAIPAAMLALLTQGLFELMERAIIPRGLRLRT